MEAISRVERTAVRRSLHRMVRRIASLREKRASTFLVITYCFVDDVEVACTNEQLTSAVQNEADGAALRLRLSTAARGGV